MISVKTTPWNIRYAKRITYCNSVHNTMMRTHPITHNTSTVATVCFLWLVATTASRSACSHLIPTKPGWHLQRGRKITSGTHADDLKQKQQLRSVSWADKGTFSFANIRPIKWMSNTWRVHVSSCRLKINKRSRDTQSKNSDGDHYTQTLQINLSHYLK